MMVEVVVDPASLHRSVMSGNVTGQIHLRASSGSFPDDQWSDFPVIVLGWWIEGLAGLLEGEHESFKGMFMDGPFCFVVRRTSGGLGEISLEENGRQAVESVDLHALLRSAVAAGEAVERACRARDWDNRDLETLKRAISRDAV